MTQYLPPPPSDGPRAFPSRESSWKEFLSFMGLMPQRVQPGFVLSPRSGIRAACLMCGAEVAARHQDRHLAWHRGETLR